MLKVTALTMLALTCACSRSAAADSFKSVEVVEVPMRTAADHNDLIAMMRTLAASHGMHVDDDSQKWADFQRSLPPKQPVDTRATIYVGVWRGSTDDDFEVSVSDMMHLGRAWVTFLKGGHEDLPDKVRQEVTGEIKRRWPNSRSVPVLPSGGEPLAEDLRLTPDGYKIVASAGPRYGLAPSSPLLVHD
jgi:hypothetical protein